MYIFVTVLIALGAFNSQNNLLFWAFGLALAVLIVSGIISGQMLMGIEVVREPPARAVVGQPTPVRYRVVNHARLAAAFALDVSERVGKGKKSEALPLVSAAGRRGDRSPSALRREIQSAPAFVVHVGPRDSVVAEGVITPAVRGVLRLDGPVVSSSFPFGIIRKSLTFGQSSTVLVHPAPVDLPAGIRRALAGAGRGRAHSRPRVGEGTEFFALREYVPGDSPTRIAWRASARSMNLLVRQTTHEEPRAVWVVLDLGAVGGMVGGTGFDAAAVREQVERAIGVAGQCIRDISAAGTPCGLALAAVSLHIPPRTAANQSLVLLDALAALDVERALAVGRPAFPAGVLRSGAPVIVHAGASDRGFGPATALRISAMEVAAAAPADGAAEGGKA